MSNHTAAEAWRRMIGECDAIIANIDSQRMPDASVSYWLGNRVAFLRMRDFAIYQLDSDPGYDRASSMSDTYMTVWIVFEDDHVDRVFDTQELALAYVATKAEPNWWNIEAHGVHDR